MSYDRPRKITWLRDWAKLGTPLARETYAREEVKRLVKEGQPLLYAIATLYTSDQIDVCRKHARALMPVVQLRLVPGAKAPENDVLGQLMPDDKRGKVLQAKVGQLAEPLDSRSDSPQAGGGGTRLDRATRGEHDYRTVEIGEEPTSVPFDDALTVLRQWGHGCEAKRFVQVGKRFYEDGEKFMRLVTIDRWIVEEVCTVTDKERAEHLKQNKKASAPSPV